MERTPTTRNAKGEDMMAMVMMVMMMMKEKTLEHNIIVLFQFLPL